jgi:hypothetical protein
MRTSRLSLEAGTSRHKSFSLQPTIVKKVAEALKMETFKMEALKIEALSLKM